MMDYLQFYRQWIRVIWWIALLLLVAVIALLLLDQLIGWRGLVVLLVIVVVVGGLSWWAARQVSARSILKVDFERGVVEQPPTDRLAQLARRDVLALRDVVDALHRAAADPRVVGLVARIGPAQLGLAHAQELRAAVQVFRQSGKRTVVWCQTLSEGQNATAEYLLASAFEQVYMQPLGEVSFTGLILQQPLLRPLLDKLGVTPRLDHRERYKTALYTFTEDHLVEPHRESLEALLGSQADQVVAAIARDRKLERHAVRRLMDLGPLQPEAAREAGLIDGVMHREPLHEHVKQEWRGRYLALSDYLQRVGRPHRGKAKIALIYGTGMVTRGRMPSRRWPRRTVMSSDAIADAFSAAIRSRHVKAIVFRVNSPGGSAVASEAIWAQVQRAREAGKPVVASLGNLAGSGGYYVVAGADRIVAQAGTITGSIGVISGKFITHDAWRKLGVNWESVAVGAHADFWSAQHDFSDSGWQALQNSIDAVYERFKQRVADGRGLSEAQVDAVAGGRIWTGQAAHEKGLVDELNGLHRAIELAQELAKIPAEQGASVVVLPRARRLPLPPRLSADDDTSLAKLMEDAEALLGPTARAAAMWRELQPGALIMPGFEVNY